jgi:hypothetical protein
MHSAAWVKLLRHIPLSEQARLMLVTASGTEISIQCFLRIDPECLALKGRLAGSQDAGRVFFVPYSHIDYFGFQQPVKESEFHEIFGNLDIPGVHAPAVPPPAAAGTPATPTAPQPSGASSETSGGTPRNPLAIKSAVLEKFRSRSTNPGTTMRPALDE